MPSSNMPYGQLRIRGKWQTNVLLRQLKDVPRTEKRVQDLVLLDPNPWSATFADMTFPSKPRPLSIGPRPKGNTGKKITGMQQPLQCVQLPSKGGDFLPFGWGSVDSGFGFDRKNRGPSPRSEKALRPFREMDRTFCGHCTKPRTVNFLYPHENKKCALFPWHLTTNSWWTHSFLIFFTVETAWTSCRVPMVCVTTCMVQTVFLLASSEHQARGGVSTNKKITRHPREYTWRNGIFYLWFMNSLLW